MSVIAVPPNVTGAPDATPFQTPPSLKNAADLSDVHEYASIWTGQSNSRPWALPSQGYTLAAELVQQATGYDFVSGVNGLTIPDNAVRAVGDVEQIGAEALTLQVARVWSTGAHLRLGTPAAPLKGYAKVIQYGLGGALTVQWIALPANNQADISGYLVRENGKYANWESVRALTPYLPVEDIKPPPVGGGAAWRPSQHAPYPTPNGAVSGGGKRLLLPAPYNGATQVTTFEDLGLFLPITKREGATGYGISEIADATFDGIVAPVAFHPLTLIAGQTFTFFGAITEVNVLTGGYLLIDWEQGGAAKRSWAKIATNSTTAFVTDAASWLGDGVPDTPVADEVTFAAGTTVTWTATPFPLVEGDRIFFTTTDTLPAEVTAGKVYTVRNVAGDTFEISEAAGRPVITFSGAGTGTHTGTRAWVYTAWIPHWRDNPYTWLPGPEFAYPNEEHQPQGTYVHFRARGQVRYNHNAGFLTPFEGADQKFGAMLPYAWRTGAAMGKRMNIVALGANSSPLAPSGLVNTAGYAGIVGWWSPERFGFGLPLENSESQLSKRLKRLITFVAPQALLAEGSTKTLRYVSAVHLQGEADSLLEAPREIYGATINDYKQWLRGLAKDNGFDPFQSEAKMPFVQPLITTHVWEVATVLQNVDEEAEVNSAIREVHTADEFGGYVLTDDLPKIDDGHYSGQGYAALAGRLAAEALTLMEQAFSYGSPALASVNSRLLRIANLALLYIGQGAKQIASLAENSAEARAVSTILPEATRQLLSMRQWSWAMRYERVGQVKHNNPNWLYAYPIPGRAITPIAILPPEVQGNNSVRLTSVVAPGTPGEYVTTPPEEFEIGRSPSGNRILYTNVNEIAGNVANQVPIPSTTLFPERLPTRAILYYVDKVVDPDRYSESFAAALSWLIASMIAPALIKGQEGEAVSTRCLQKAAAFIRTEATHETVTRQKKTEHTPSWIGVR